MTLKIGEKIKGLREKRNVTQSKMAGYLGITEQAISRWENGGGYPDMELIPAIANFLDVSADVLFEMDKKEARLASLKRAVTEKSIWRDHKSNYTAIEMYREILREFPNDYGTMFQLIARLGEENYVGGEQSAEIISLCERIIADSSDLNLRRIATCSLARAYKQAGKREKAVTIVKDSLIVHSLSDGIGFSKENTLAYGIADGEEAAANQKDVMQHLCNELCISIRHFNMDSYTTCSVGGGKSNDEWRETLRRQIAAREKLIKIAEVFYEDGDFGGILECLLYSHIELAEYYIVLGECGKALDSIEKCAGIAIAYDMSECGLHTSALVKNVKICIDNSLVNYGSHAENVRYNQCYRVIHDWLLGEDADMLSPAGEGRAMKSSYEFYAPIRETDRFKSIVEKLKKHAKIKRDNAE